MSLQSENPIPARTWTEIPAEDDFASALLEEWAPSGDQSINERRASTENPATLRLARSF